jgi:hypothetical protein
MASSLAFTFDPQARLRHQIKIAEVPWSARHLECRDQGGRKSPYHVAQGATGAQGVTGAQGTTGAQGPTGAQDATGRSSVGSFRGQGRQRCVQQRQRRTRCQDDAQRRGDRLHRSLRAHATRRAVISTTTPSSRPATDTSLSNQSDFQVEADGSVPPASSRSQSDGSTDLEGQGERLQNRCSRRTHQPPHQ